MDDHKDRTGQRIDDYQLLLLLGQGTFGDVYLAEHLHQGTKVAIKVLKTQFDQEMIKSFLNEARTLFLLKHRSIVPLLDFGIHRDLPFLVIEYAPNGTLRQRHRVGERVPLRLVNAYVQQVGSALQYAHERRLIHRDVKPQNILLGVNDQVLLSDFGVTAIAHSDNSVTSHEMSGTVPYIAPEQIEGKPRPATDQYALGICVYEWLCGTRPFLGSTWEIIKQHLSIPPAAPRTHTPEVPPAVEEVVLRTLAKDPLERFPSMTDFANALLRASQTTISYSPLSPNTGAQQRVIAPLTPIVPVPDPFQGTALAAPRPKETQTEPSHPNAGSFPSAQPGEPATHEAPTVLFPAGNPPFQGGSPAPSLPSQPPFAAAGPSLPSQPPFASAAPSLPSQPPFASAGPSSSPPQPPFAAATPSSPSQPPLTSFGSATPWPRIAPTMPMTTRPPRRKLSRKALLILVGMLVLVLAGVVLVPLLVNKNNKQAPPTTEKQLAAIEQNIRATAVAQAASAAPAYQNWVNGNGMMFGFDAAHTRWNRLEQAISPGNAAHLHLRWTYRVNGLIEGSLTIADGLVYAGSDDGKLYAFDARCQSSCQALWSYTTGGFIRSTPAVANGILYFGSDDGKLYAFDASCRQDCQPLWFHKTSGGIDSSPTVANGIVYVGSWNDTLYAFDANCRSACQPLWSYLTGGGVFSSPAVAGGMVYAGSIDGKLYAFDATCRKACHPLWSFATGGKLYSSPAVAGGIVYIGSDDKNLYAFDATCRHNCQPLWVYATGAGVRSSPAIANGLVYVGSDDDRFYAFDASCRSSCQPLWSYLAGGDFFSSPTVANGVVYVGSGDHMLYAFDTSCRSSCRPLWTYQTNGVVHSSPAVANGMIYIGTHKNTFYAFGPGI